MREPHQVPARVQELAAQLAEPQPMRRGSLSERYVKCSKPGCACAKQPEERHGPYYSLTRAVAGRAQSRFLSAPRADLVRRQVEAEFGPRGREETGLSATGHRPGEAVVRPMALLGLLRTSTTGLAAFDVALGERAPAHGLGFRQLSGKFLNTSGDLVRFAHSSSLRLL